MTGELATWTMGFTMTGELATWTIGFTMTGELATWTIGFTMTGELATWTIGFTMTGELAKAVPVVAMETQTKEAERSINRCKFIGVQLLWIQLCTKIVPQKLHSFYDKSNYFRELCIFSTVLGENPQTIGLSVILTSAGRENKLRK
jgi:hypothetical protein